MKVIYPLRINEWWILSSPFALLTDWQSKGKKWRYLNQPIMASFTIPALDSVQLPVSKLTYNYPEIIICQLTALFDNPLCGIRIVTEPNFDSKELFTVANASQFTMTDPQIYALVPPHSLPGLYLLRIPSFWFGLNTLQLFVINTDAVPHRCIGVGYLLAVTAQGGS